MSHALCGSCFRRVIHESSPELRHAPPTIERSGRRCCGCAFIVAVFYVLDLGDLDRAFPACLHTGWDVRAPSPGGAA